MIFVSGRDDNSALRMAAKESEQYPNVCKTLCFRGRLLWTAWGPFCFGNLVGCNTTRRVVPRLGLRGEWREGVARWVQAYRREHGHGR